jgi:hypothetical protein
MKPLLETQMYLKHQDEIESEEKPVFVVRPKPTQRSQQVQQHQQVPLRPQVPTQSPQTQSSETSQSQQPRRMSAQQQWTQAKNSPYGPCFNCNEEGHIAPYCPHPCGNCHQYGQGIAGSLGRLGSQQIRVTRAPKISTNLVRVRGPIILRLREPPTDSRQDRMLKNIKEDVSNS